MLISAHIRLIRVRDRQTSFYAVTRRVPAMRPSGDIQRSTRLPATDSDATSLNIYRAFTCPEPGRFDRAVSPHRWGSGASFTFGMVRHMLYHMEVPSAEAAKTSRKGSTNMDVDFTCVARRPENLTWFTTSLRILRSHPPGANISVPLRATRLFKAQAASLGPKVQLALAGQTSKP